MPLDRICPLCGEPLGDDRPNQARFCSLKCAKRSSDIKPERREQKRAYMAEYLERPGNREAARKRHREWYDDEANAETVRARSSAWIKANPAAHRDNRRRTKYKRREAAVEGVPVTRSLIEARFEYWGNRCYLCGTDSVPMTVDHVIAISRGGLDVPANIRPACMPCNFAKRDRALSDVVGGGE